MPPLDQTLLPRIAIFGALSAPCLAMLTQRLKPASFGAGEFVYREHDPARSMFIIETGQVGILKDWEGKQYLLGHHGSGECIGEMALMDMQPRSASVICIEATTLLELHAEALLELYQLDLEQFTLLQMNLGREVSRRLREADKRMFLCRLDASAHEVPPEFAWTGDDPKRPR